MAVCSCEKGKCCMCYEYDFDTGRELGSNYVENKSSCHSAAVYYGMQTDDTYFICYEIDE